MAVQRLVLFDIDGTLVRAGPVGAVVFNRAIEAVLGEVPAERVSMSGKTDPQIVREYLALVHSGDPSHMPAVLGHLERELAEAAAELARDGQPCAGAPELLAALAADNRLHLSVLTGNIAAGRMVFLAVERFLDDLRRADAKDPAFPYYFDQAGAVAIIKYFRDLCPFKLVPFEQFIAAKLGGTSAAQIVFWLKLARGFLAPSRWERVDRSQVSLPGQG